MLKYFLAAQGLRMFSCTPATRKLYRFIGNQVFSKRRVQRGVPATYFERTKEHVSRMRRLNILREGDTVLDLGTGWLHWGAIFLRCYFKIKATLFDVWDNRQWNALVRYTTEYDQKIDEISTEIGEDEAEVHGILTSIMDCQSFDELYDRHDMSYHVDPNGSLASFDDDHFNLVYSSDVFEHVDEAILQTYITDIFRITKKGGYSFHQIVYADHLAMQYDLSVNWKNYLKYSDGIWNSFFHNKVQYINRIQHSAFLRMFEKAGFELVESDITDRADVTGMPIHKKFENLDRDDLESTVAILVHKKP